MISIPDAGFFHDPLPDPAIEEHGAIGDHRSLALVSRSGCIDWWCTPDFSGPSCFAALLDGGRGGRFAVAPREVLQLEQFYLPESNVLCTRFRCRGGVLELLDCMTLPEAEQPGIDGTGAQPAPEIVRLAHCTEGAVELQVLFQPRPDYARQQPLLEPVAPGQWRCAAAGFEAALFTCLPLQPLPDASLGAVAGLRAGDRRFLLLRAAAAAGSSQPETWQTALGRLEATHAWWRRWSERCTYRGRYREPVLRSALALKLLAHPNGAVVAAGTTSLPESETGARNWDYRYCWLRDTSLVLHAFTDIGYTGESDAFLHWLLRATETSRPRVQALYGLHGDGELEERILPHLRGYRGIGPVRIGNAASHQVQHDVYGELLLTACDDVEGGGELDAHEQDLLAGFTHLVCDIWREPDHGLWEIRLPPRHNTHSKVMCWVALDRALLLQRDFGLPIDVPRVVRERAALRADIEANGFDPAVGSYIGYYGSQAPDASLLLLPRLGYIAADHPRMRGTVEHVLRNLQAGGLLYRYPPGPEYDGVAGPEHLFAICSFWCVDCLARQGRLDEAHAMYQRLLRLRNHVGLYAEEFRESDGRPMGNFPQAFSHVGAITAALALEEAERRAAMGGPRRRDRAAPSGG